MSIHQNPLPYNIMDISSSQLENFECVWKELLKQKIDILYKISHEKNENFLSLMNQFLPEAFDYKNIWEDKYILPSNNLSENKTTNNSLSDFINGTDNSSCEELSTITNKSDNSNLKKKFKIKKPLNVSGIKKFKIKT